MKIEKQQICENCGYFLQHYIWYQHFKTINCGHCTHPPRARQCKPLMAACPKWIPQDETYRTNNFPLK